MTETQDIRLIVVDDHPLVRDGLRARLEAVPRLHVVGEAGSGEEALALAQTLRPDLALVDISMPDMNGLELAALLHERQPDTAVVILSMFDTPEYVSQALRAGARGYVLKDAPSKEIIAAIAAVSAGGTYYSAALTRSLAQSPPRQAVTDREKEVLILLAQGASNKRVAQILDISSRTVETHRLSLRRKLGIETTAGLVKYALEQGWLKG